MTPAGFWTNFHADLITINDSDQGPWGGHREICWKSETKKTFSAGEIIDFAVSNGWHLTDSLRYINNSLKPLTNYPNTDYSFHILEGTVMKRMISADTRIFVFETGWIAVEPGNARETKENGFVAINSDGTEFKIYHLWGE